MASPPKKQESKSCRLMMAVLAAVLVSGLLVSPINGEIISPGEDACILSCGALGEYCDDRFCWCCTGHCVNHVCTAPPPPPPCLASGAFCDYDGTQCCSRVCLEFNSLTIHGQQVLDSKCL